MRWLLTAQCKRFAHGVLFAVRPSARNSIADKCFLVGGQIYDHEVQPTPARRAKQGRLSGHFAEKCVALNFRALRSACAIYEIYTLSYT
jgi:hypothetical protein